MFSFDGRGLGLNIELSPGVVLILVIIGIAVWLKLRSNGWQANEVEINVFGQKVKIKPNFEVARIAHKAWTELTSRKAAIEFEVDHDVITEVYDSWYALFAEIRGLVKEIPAEKIRNDPEVRKLVQVMMNTLNQGLRPHLTKWQANFRRWITAETKRRDADENTHISPQEIQRSFPQYDELVEDLQRVNQFLIGYAKALEEIAHGQAADAPPVEIPRP